ncbi:MAG: hypothetical protein RMM98_16015 [Acidobacteriota bacterium]|nr:hypothetical protein [Blastocatellia bacterium]MDW8241109.1 hypothetical protein [Acidobacteriota bacterium]
MRWLLFLCVTILCIGCNKTKIETLGVLVMVDFSVSARPDLPDYRKYLSVILNEMPADSRLVVGKIGETTEATFDPFINETFPDEDFWTTNPQDVADEKEAIRKRFETRCEEAFQNPTLSPWTNIVSALSLVKQVFPDSKRRVLVLLSDMLHSSSDFDLEKVNITDEYIEATIDRLKREDRLPRLDGVEVYVAGARAPTDERYRAVRKFWGRVFEETGVQLKSYGHTLLNFELR